MYLDCQSTDPGDGPAPAAPARTSLRKGKPQWLKQALGRDQADALRLVQEMTSGRRVCNPGLGTNNTNANRDEIWTPSPRRRRRRGLHMHESVSSTQKRNKQNLWRMCDSLEEPELAR